MLLLSVILISKSFTRTGVLSLTPDLTDPAGSVHDIEAIKSSVPEANTSKENEDELTSVFSETRVFPPLFVMV